MTTFNLFSKRQKLLRGEVPDVYIHDELPQKLRIQIIHIIKDAIGEGKISSTLPNGVYKYIHDRLSREYGVFSLNDSHEYSNKIRNFFLSTTDIEQALDVVELTFRYIDRLLRNNFHDYSRSVDIKLEADAAIKELNERFKENGIGYSYEAGEIIRVDSTYIHSEITKPTISLLWNDKFNGANEEYLKAHEHYRHGLNKECLADCLKAFESTLKIICTEKEWAFKLTDTSKKLIQVCFSNELVPTFTQNQFTSLQNLLESGIPTIRNKLGGHGQGQIPQKVDDEMTRYGLNLTGTNIIFLIELSGIK